MAVPRMQQAMACCSEASHGLKDGSAVTFAIFLAIALFVFALGFVVGWACKESDWK
jgi:hypothetical protein